MTIPLTDTFLSPTGKLFAFRCWKTASLSPRRHAAEGRGPSLVGELFTSIVQFSSASSMIRWGHVFNAHALKSHAQWHFHPPQATRSLSRQPPPLAIKD